VALYNLIPEDELKQNHWNINAKIIDKDFSLVYFDGFAQQNGCGRGAVLYLNEDHYYKMKLGLGRGTNNYA